MSVRPVRVAGIYVEEDERGRGVGTRLVEGLFTWAGGRGVARVSIAADAANGRAVNLYRRLGFEDRSLSLERAL